MDWGDDVGRQLHGGYYVSDPANPGALRHVDEAMDGLRPVEIQSGSVRIQAELDPSTGQVYYAWDDLPETAQQKPGLLRDLLDSSDVQTMLSQADDHFSVPEARVERLHSVWRDLDSGDLRAVADSIPEDPFLTWQLIDSQRRQALATIDDLIRQGNTTDALAMIDKQIGIYGNTPELTVRRGIALLRQGQFDEAAAALGQGRSGPRFYDEITDRLASAPSPVDQNDLYRVTQVSEWNQLGDQYPGLSGYASAVPGDRQLALRFTLDPQQTSFPISADSLDDGLTLYVQDAPTLNNLDWSASPKRTLHEAVSGDLAEVVALPRGDIKHFSPAEVYTADNTMFKLVSQRPAVNMGTYVTFSLPPGSTPDRCEDPADPDCSVYLVCQPGSCP
jgi:hypothetical protein